ncbi:MAG: sugar nucleotide-binding protein [Bacteriovoracales bacterium]|nr:sugar nucleotide-binding protein [Bacteriovoracales bacterium]
MSQKKGNEGQGGSDEISQGPKKTILIFGISSFVGSNLAEYLKKDYRVIGTYKNNPVEIEGILTFPLDILSQEAIQLALASFLPEITIYCVGLSSLEACHANEGEANILNATGAFNVVGFTERYKSRLIYISSAYVFAGERIMYQEEDMAISNSSYGKSKASAEFFIQKTCLNYLILRCCDFYGRGLLEERATWFEILQKKLFEGIDVGLDDSIKVGFLDVIYLAMIIKISIEKDIHNKLFHISSTDIMSGYEFALQYAKLFDENETLIAKKFRPFPNIESSMIQPRFGQDFEYQIEIENAQSVFNVKMPSISESLALTKYLLGGTEKKNSFSKRDRSEIEFI